MTSGKMKSASTKPLKTRLSASRSNGILKEPERLSQRNITRKNNRTTDERQVRESNRSIPSKKRGVPQNPSQEMEEMNRGTPSRKKTKNGTGGNRLSPSTEGDQSSKDMNTSSSNGGSSDHDGVEHDIESDRTPEIDEAEPLDLMTNNLASRRREKERLRSRFRVDYTSGRRMELYNAANSSPITQNQMKLDLMEAIRDKRAYAAAFLALKEQKTNVDNELQKLKHENCALQTSLGNAKAGRKGRKPVWSQESLKGTNIDAFQGICLAAGAVAKKEAVFVTTETYWDEADQRRLRNWTGASTTVTPDVAADLKLTVLLPNGVHGVPNCSMKRALEGEDYSSGLGSPKLFASYCLKKVLDGPIGAVMSEREKSEGISKIIAHKPTVQKFRGILSDSIGNRKKAALQVYLRTLGYTNGAKPNSKHLSENEKVSRISEREYIFKKILRVDALGKADTMRWRLCNQAHICNPGSGRAMESGSGSSDEEEGFIDTIFMNNASRRAFQCLRGYNVPKSQKDYLTDVSILCLARADAYMTTMLKWIKVGGKGGVRNCDIRDCFREMVPKAMSNILQDVWNDIKELAPHEMSPYIGNSREFGDDPFGNNVREWTFVIIHPDDNFLYLLVRPCYFLKMVCSWFGTIKDCHVGRCKKEDEIFIRIEPSIGLDEVEESDLDDDVQKKDKDDEVADTDEDDRIDNTVDQRNTNNTDRDNVSMEV